MRRHVQHRADRIAGRVNQRPLAARLLLNCEAFGQPGARIIHGAGLLRRDRGRDLFIRPRIVQHVAEAGLARSDGCGRVDRKHQAFKHQPHARHERIRRHAQRARRRLLHRLLDGLVQHYRQFHFRDMRIRLAALGRWHYRIQGRYGRDRRRDGLRNHDRRLLLRTGRGRWRSGGGRRRRYGARGSRRRRAFVGLLENFAPCGRKRPCRARRARRTRRTARGRTARHGRVRPGQPPWSGAIGTPGDRCSAGSHRVRRAACERFHAGRGIAPKPRVAELVEYLLNASLRATEQACASTGRQIDAGAERRNRIGDWPPLLNRSSLFLTRQVDDATLLEALDAATDGRLQHATRGRVHRFHKRRRRRFFRRDPVIDLGHCWSCCGHRLRWRDPVVHFGRRGRGRRCLLASDHSFNARAPVSHHTGFPFWSYMRPF